MSEDIDAEVSGSSVRAGHGADSLPKIGAPATRALAGIGVTAMSQLARHTERELLELHGFGPKAIRLLREAGATFRSE